MDKNDKAFKDLQAKWYAKLKRTGFNDIEQDEDHLKVWSSSFFRAHGDPIANQAKEDYYRMAGQFLHSYNFETTKAQTIWQLHSEGKSIDTITKLLKSKKVKTNKLEVWKTIQKLSQVMTTTWKMEQLI